MTHYCHNAFRTLDKTISSLEMQLAAARAAKVNDDVGSPVVTKLGSEQFKDRPKVFFVMGIITAFSSRKRRDSIRETWMPQGSVLSLIAFLLKLTLSRSWNKLIANIFAQFRWRIKEVGKREGNYNAVCYRTQVSLLELARNLHTTVACFNLLILTKYSGLNFWSLVQLQVVYWIALLMQKMSNIRISYDWYGIVWTKLTIVSIYY